MSENLIINRVSIHRKGLEPKTYLLPSITDLLTDGLIKRNHLDWNNIKEYLDAIYESKTAHTQDINNINSRLITLSIDNDGNLDYNGLKFLNVINYLPSGNTDDLNSRISNLETATSLLTTSVNNISAILEGLSTQYASKSHTHNLFDLSGILEDGTYLSIGTSNNKFVETLSTKLIELRALAAGSGKVYVTPKVRANEKAILVAEPNEGQKFINWTYNNLVISTNAIHILDTPLSGEAYIGSFAQDDSSVPVEPLSYTLTLSSIANGIVTITIDNNEVISPVQVPYGKRVYLRAVPNIGYKFGQWIGVTGSSAETSFVMDKDYIIGVTFVEDETQKVYQYQAHVLPANAPELTNLVASVQVINTNIAVNYGNSFTLQVPNEDIVPTNTTNGYRFLKWTADYISNNETTARTWTGTAGAPETYTSQPLLNPNGLTNFYANYQLTFLVKVGTAKSSTGASLGQSATIKLNGLTLGQSSVIVDNNYAGSVIIVASNISGYTFLQWSDGNTSSSRTLTKGTSIEVYPIYTQNAPSTYTVTASAQTTGTGSVSGGGTYNTGSSVTLTATPATGYHFVRWTDGNTDNPRLVTVTSNVTYTAVFEINTYTVTVNVLPANSGQINGLSSSYNYDEDCTITAQPATGYHFVEWQENNLLIYTEAAYEFVVSSNRTLIAVFAKNSYTITTTATNGGSASPASQNPEHGDSVTVTATPDTGYKFTKWTKGTTTTQVSTNNPYTFNASADITLKANFTKKTYTITVSANPSAGGTVSASPSTVEHGGPTTLTATPNENYTFEGWKEGSTTLSSNTVSNITSNRTFVAYFTYAEPQSNDIYYFVANTWDATDLTNLTSQIAELSITGNEKPFNVYGKSLSILVPTSIGEIIIKDNEGDDVTSSFTKTLNFEYNSNLYIRYYKSPNGTMNTDYTLWK